MPTYSFMTTPAQEAALKRIVDAANANLQTRVAELETKLQSLGLLS